MTGAALQDRVAIGFGPAMGIGAASARTLADRGATLILAGIAVEAARRTAARIAASEFRQSLARNHLTPYIGEPQDIANVVAFLAGDDSRFVTGHLFSVDGGLSAHQGMYADLVGDVA